jgi:hypothetical protein
MNNNQIRRKILELLYTQSRKCASYVKIEHLIENIDEIEVEDLLVNINYLAKKGYVHIKQMNDGFNTAKSTITAKGIILIENDDTLNSKFPVK